jgi:hypothetical protein
MSEIDKLTWGLGLEHEMHIFHRPKEEHIILFDSYSARQRLLNLIEKNKVKVTEKEETFLRSVPYEQTGRMCNGKWVIKKVPYNMPEFVTQFPFCSIRKGRDLIAMTGDIINLKKLYIRLLMKDPVTQTLVKKYGELIEYPFGMTRYLKCPSSLSVKGYQFFEKKMPEYTGSYHITLTLPYKNQTTNSQFIKMHQNFANQLQWLEPLMLTSYFSCDQYAVGSAKKRVRGSFRVMMIGWGNFAGSDVRQFKTGIGRYGVIPIHWRKGLDFENLDRLKVCYKPSPSAQKEKAITSLSSDFRTFGNPDPTRPDHRESGSGMTIPNGIEFRIFDQFNDANITNLVKLISLVAENSRNHYCRGYVYKNKEWIDNIQEIMRSGYKAKLTKGYIKLLRDKLDLKIKTTSIIAYDVFKEICDELHYKNYNGLWTKLFYTDKYIYTKEEIDTIKLNTPKINQYSWFMSFFLKMNHKPLLLERFNVLINSFTLNKEFDVYVFEMMVNSVLGPSYRDNYDDILYCLEFLSLIKLKKNKNGTLKSYIFIRKNRYKNFNEEIDNFFLDNYNDFNLI